MTLTFKIRNLDRLENGMPAEYVLNRRGAVIGRAATCDWSLPDARNYISSRHCDVAYRDGSYIVTDVSTNGTFLNGNPDRMTAPRRVEPDDRFLVGQYELVAELTGEAVAAIERREEQAAADAQSQGGWSWDAHGATPVTPPPATDRGGWGSDPASSGPANSGLASGFGGASAPLDGGWGSPAPGPAPRDDGWASTPAAPAATDDGGWGSPGAPPSAPSVWEGAPAPIQQASAWSSAVDDRPRDATPNDIWGSMESSNVVDWARADFGRKVDAPADPLGLTPKPAAQALPAARPVVPSDVPPASGGGWGTTAGTIPPETGWATTPRAPPSAAPPPIVAPAPAVGVDLAQAVKMLAAAAGLPADQVKQPGPETLERLGGVLRRLVSGLVVMVEARARAKSQMGAEQTGLEFDGNNPIKFARTPEQAIAQLINPTERGFMPAERAVEDAYFDLQSHQMATLRAMQGALKATLDRFSPTAIKARAESAGFMARLLPGGREATLWQTYEREFSGVKQGSDEAFMDMFAKEFRKAYDEQSRNRRKT